MQKEKIAKKGIILEKKSKTSASKETASAENKPRHNVWKFVAIAFMVVFVIFIAGMFIKAHNYRPLPVHPTQEQVDYAKQIATEKLESIGENVSEYDVHVAEMIRKVPFDGSSQNIIQVSLNKNMTTHTYVIDINSGEVIMHSQTDIYKELGKPKGRECDKNDPKCGVSPQKKDGPGFRSPWSGRGFFFWRR